MFLVFFPSNLQYQWNDDNAHPGVLQPGSVPTRPDVLRSILRIYKHPPGCQLIKKLWHCHGNIDGSVQDCSISSTLAMEILQFCTKPSIYPWRILLDYISMQDSPWLHIHKAISMVKHLQLSYMKHKCLHQNYSRTSATVIIAVTSLQALIDIIASTINYIIVVCNKQECDWSAAISKDQVVCNINYHSEWGLCFCLHTCRQLIPCHMPADHWDEILDGELHGDLTLVGCRGREAITCAAEGWGWGLCNINLSYSRIEIEWGCHSRLTAVSWVPADHLPSDVVCMRWGGLMSLMRLQWCVSPWCM